MSTTPLFFLSRLHSSISSDYPVTSFESIPALRSTHSPSNVHNLGGAFLVISFYGIKFHVAFFTEGLDGISVPYSSRFFGNSNAQTESALFVQPPFNPIFPLPRKKKKVDAQNGAYQERTGLQLTA